MPPRVLAVAVLAQVLGGLTPVWTKLALVGLPPWTLVFSRQTIGLRPVRARRAPGGARRRVAAPWTRARRRAPAADLVGWLRAAAAPARQRRAARSTAVALRAAHAASSRSGSVLGSASCSPRVSARARAIAVALGTLGASLVVPRTACAPISAIAFGDVR